MHVTQPKRRRGNKAARKNESRRKYLDQRGIEFFDHETGGFGYCSPAEHRAHYHQFCSWNRRNQMNAAQRRAAARRRNRDDIPF